MYTEIGPFDVVASSSGDEEFELSFSVVRLSVIFFRITLGIRMLISFLSTSHSALVFPGAQRKR